MKGDDTQALAAIHEEAEALFWALAGDETENNPAACAALFAALAREGWTGRAAYDVVYEAAGEDRDLAASERASATLTPWAAWDDVPEAAKAARVLRELLRQHRPVSDIAPREAFPDLAK